MNEIGFRKSRFHGIIVIVNKQIYQENCTLNQYHFQLVLPLNIEVLIPENDSVRLVSQITEELDFRSLNMAYSSKGRNPAIPPRILFSILIYAYMNGIYSSRQIEKACRRDINFMWLLEGNRAPDHNTIDRFRRERLGSCLESLFGQFIEKLYEWDEISFENLYIDGTKIEANANKYSFVWRKSIEKHSARQEEKILQLHRKMEEAYGVSFNAVEVQALLKEMASFLLDKKTEESIEFVYGSGKRKNPLQRLTEECLELLEKRAHYEKCKDTFRDRNSFSKTDPDATFMHMKDDHMRNAQLKPGYNMQIGVEAGYVVHCQAYAQRNDVRTLIPFLESWDRLHPEASYENIVADAGYESEENYDFLMRQSKNIFIKPQTYDQWKKRSFKKLIGKLENMAYDEEKDCYVCTEGRQLLPKRTWESRNGATSYITKYTEYECENCEGCPVKAKCTKAAGNRKAKVSKRFKELRALSHSNIQSPRGVVLRINRSIQVEGAFGVLKEDMGFRRFLTRGHVNISTEFMLLCFGFNVNKLHRKTLNNQRGFKIYHSERLGCIA